MKLKPDVKRKWVKALRSGKYKKANGSLKKGGSYCALGVLYEIFSEETGQEWDNLHGNGIVQWATGRDCYEHWNLFYGGYQQSVPILNDERKLSLKKIADLIEQQA